MDGELKYWVGISGFEGLGFKRFQLLKQYFGSVKKIWEAGFNDYVRVGVKPASAEKWRIWQNRNLDEEMKELGRREIKVITIDDKRYPGLLKEIDSPPIAIYAKGEVDCLEDLSLTVVGSRKMSGYGRRIVNMLVKGLTDKGWVIVSGLARGIDGEAHRACLSNQGRTVAVLGHGLERVYPKEHCRLAEAIIKRRGVLVSEYPLNFPITRSNFPARDRIMAGLSLGTVVIEGAKKSGTKITANMAADYNREVFCVPGSIGHELSEGPAELIQAGAKLVTKVEDILEEIKLPVS